MRQVTLALTHSGVTVFSYSPPCGTYLVSSDRQVFSYGTEHCFAVAVTQSVWRCTVYKKETPAAATPVPKMQSNATCRRTTEYKIGL